MERKRGNGKGERKRERRNMKKRGNYMGERRIENGERKEIKGRKWKARNYKEKEIEKEERCEKDGKGRRGKCKKEGKGRQKERKEQ